MLEVHVSGGSNPLGDTMGLMKRSSSDVDVDYRFQDGQLDPDAIVTPECRKHALDKAHRILRSIEISRDEKLSTETFVDRMLEIASFLVGDSHIEDSGVIEFDTTLE